MYQQWLPIALCILSVTPTRDYADILDFLEEEKLAANSLSVDIIVRKKTPEAITGKNIARIFRAFNIVEYKSPADTFSVKDFYKVHSYTTLLVSSRRDAEISGVTMNLVSAGCPRKLLEYLDGIFTMSAVPVRGFSRLKGTSSRFR